MFKYKITIDPKVIAILGPHLYGDTASIIAELVSNCYDADADSCWVTIKTGGSPEIIIEDNGIGMTQMK
jgi:HSP90 family molecular chaperone